MNKDEFAGTAKKVEGSAQNAFGEATGMSSQEAKGEAKKVIGSIQNKLGNAEEHIENSYNAAKNYISDQPVKSALIAVGIGFILSNIIRL